MLAIADLIRFVRHEASDGVAVERCSAHTQGGLHPPYGWDATLSHL